MVTPIKILFIINPISGVGKKNTIPPLIESILDKTKFQWDIKYTERRKHGFDIANENKDKFNAIVAVGGDGSVNEIGSALIGTNCALGIIPCGSGNGLARHLNIPLKAKPAIERIASFQLQKMDTGTLNGVPFLGTCGFGFDGYIANKFDEFGKRGFLSYIKLVSSAYGKYGNSTFTVNGSDVSIKQDAFLCSIANSSEFGNGFNIAPSAKTNDGQFELVLMERFPLVEAPFIIKKFFGKSIHKSKFYKILPFTQHINVKVNGPHPPYFHIDGEPLKGSTEFNVSINPLSLNII